MKLMLVADEPALKPFLERNFSFQQADVIHYDNPIKAMDNVGEIQPAVVLFSASDFPRHWKPFAIFLRNTFSRHEAIFILLIGENFDPEDANKAEFLEVNAVLDEDLSSGQTLERIRGIITRYHQNSDIRRSVRFIPSPGDNVHLAFTNPYSFSICAGTVVDISTGGLRFRPDDPQISDNLDDHTVITMASVRLGDALLPVALRIIRITETIAFEYVDLSVEIEEQISSYLSFLADQEMAPVTEAGFTEEG